MTHKYSDGFNQETPLITEQQLFSYIQSEIKKSGSQKAFANQLGISISYLNDYLSGRRKAGSKILSALDLIRVVHYKSL